MSLAPSAIAPELNGHPHTPVPVYENSPTFRMACRQLESVAEAIEIDKGILSRLALPKRAMVVSARSKWTTAIPKFSPVIASSTA